jgi:hypothetical protein
MMVLSPLLIVLVAAGAAVLVVLWVAARRRRTAAVGEPVCGACGYSTTGLTSFTCPECGGDLRSVGILTPGTARPGWGFAASAAAFLVLWGFCLPPLAGLVSAVAPARKFYERRVRLDGPPSRLYDGVVVSAEGTAWGDAPPARPFDVTVELVPPATPVSGAKPIAGSRLTVNVNTGAYRYADAAGGAVHRDSGFGQAAVLDWLAAAGVDVASPPVRKEAALITATVHRVARVRYAVIGNSGYSGTIGANVAGAFGGMTETDKGHSGGSDYAVQILFGAWLLLCIGGLRYLWHMTRAKSVVRG